MSSIEKKDMNRRDFMKTSATAAAATGAVAMGAGEASAKTTDDLDHRNEQTDKMTYKQLGKTKFMSSRLVFGGGGALIAGKGVRLLERSFQAGINNYDLGTNVYYKGAERSFSEFCKRHRDDIWVTSKAMVRADITFRGADKPTSAGEAAKYATFWLEKLDASLKDLGTDYVDAYFLMGVDNPEIVKSEEMGNAFLRAKDAGKVGYFGISTHANAEACLEAATDTGWYSLAQIAIAPSGWFNLADAFTAKGEGKGLPAVAPVLDRARDAGIGLIAMKVALGMAAAPWSGRTDKDETSPKLHIYDKFFNAPLTAAPMTPFQRAYAHMLTNGLDAVNSDMQNFKHFEENIVAVNSAEKYHA